jgi:hypothetical protein
MKFTITSRIRQELGPYAYTSPIDCFGDIEIRPGAFGPILVVTRGDSAAILPIDTARILFGAEVIEEMVNSP